MIAGDGLRDIAGRFGLSKSAVERHKAAHLPARLAQAHEAQEISQADDLLTQLRDLQARTLAILGKAELVVDLRTALQAIREARGNLELLGKLAGELQQEGTVNIVVNAEWIQLRGAILVALGPYPEARAALVEAISHVSG
jgi:hypothetical protein